ncbi:MAG: hypothetical protein H6819_06775 [Phycisphaerales bacterium]|nr:hypothetical protein [Phycisphaerales bacterium]MCB9855285.1 hypothetical protein [Phycisphaerales bacterium]MCB9862878.1 hypothetical protein [Phycisphaerales bacterium]
MMATTTAKRRSRRTAEPVNAGAELSPAAQSKICYLEFMARLMRHMQAAIRNGAPVTKGATYYGGHEMTDEVRSMVDKAANVHGFECTIDTGGMDAYSIRLRFTGGNAK